MAVRFVNPYVQWVSGNSVVYTGAKLYFYTTGTSTPKTTYSDSALSVANSNPVVADANGKFGDIFLSTGLYKAVLKDSADATIWTADPIGDSLEDLTVTGAFAISGLLTPAQITADQNNYDPSGLASAVTLRLSTDASRNVTGIAGGAAGRILIIRNVGSFNLVLKDESASSTAANRLSLFGDVTIQPDQAATLQYDTTSSRWFAVSVPLSVVEASNLSGSAMGFNMINGTLTATVGSNALTIAVKTFAGLDPSASSPVHVLFRNVSLGVGDYALVTLTAATSFVVSSGSTLGTLNSTAFRLWVVGFNDGGTFRLGVINCRSGNNIYQLGQIPVATSTAEGGAGAADSAQTYYTGTAVTSKAYSILGYLTYESGLATAGTWSAGPTRLQLFGDGVPLPGELVQVVNTPSSAVATGSTIMPMDDTIPQNTEGDQYMSQAIVPASACDLLDIDIVTNYGVGSVGQRAVCALFQDSTAGALAAVPSNSTTSNGPRQSNFKHMLLAGTTASTTFKIRIGPSTADTVTFNGVASARLLGGVISSSITITEIMS